MTQEALKLALEALEELNSTNSYWWQDVDEETIAKIDPAITAIKQALAQKQEPIAMLFGSLPVYDHTAPPQRTKQNFCSRCGKRTADLTTIHTCTPPQD